MPVLALLGTMRPEGPIHVWTYSHPSDLLFRIYIATRRVDSPRDMYVMFVILKHIVKYIFVYAISHLNNNNNI